MKRSDVYAALGVAAIAGGLGWLTDWAVAVVVVGLALVVAAWVEDHR